MLLISASVADAAPPQPAPEARALAYLAQEVPRWRKENGCFSCHHNGDATRALADGVARGLISAPPALAETTAWLARPADWDHNGGDGGVSDRKLASLQFAAALAGAHAARLTRDRKALDAAARLVLDLQDREGCWTIAPAEAVGSPATHGTALATILARRTLRAAGVPATHESLQRSASWLRRASVARVLDAAAVLLGLEGEADPEAEAQRVRCQETIRRGESPRGGWGPHVNSGPEAFDTAVVVLALAGQRQTPEVRGWLRRGRAHLLAEQEKDGSWPETTRPAGGESLAQKLSTTGWATLALLATRSPSR